MRGSNSGVCAQLGRSEPKPLWSWRFFFCKMVLVNQHFLLKASTLTSCCSIGLKRNLDTIFFVVFSWTMCLPIPKEKSCRFMPFTCNSVFSYFVWQEEFFFLSFWDYIPHSSCKVTQTESEVTSIFLILKLLKQQVCFPSINHHAFLFCYCHVATVQWEFFLTFLISLTGIFLSSLETTWLDIV